MKRHVFGLTVVVVSTRYVHGRTYVIIVYYIGFIIKFYVYGEANAGFILFLIVIAVIFFIIS